MSRRYVILFKERFAPLVEAGTKRQTIRPERRDGFRIEAGDLLSLRAWSGLPYRSKQRLLRPECPCVASCEVMLSSGGVVETKGQWVRALDNDQLDDFAKVDGFADYEEMLAWFRETHGLPFQCRLIGW